MIDRRRLADALRAEEERFIKTHKRSGDLANDAKTSMLSGVPMAWIAVFTEGLDGIVAR